MPATNFIPRAFLFTSATATFLSLARSQSCSAIMANGAPYSVYLVTTPSEDVAKSIARGLVTEKLVACVNIIPKITSIYHWDDKVQEDSESLMVIKSRRNRFEDINKYVKSKHPYEVCEVISLPITEGNPPYLDWIGKYVPLPEK